MLVDAVKFIRINMYYHTVHVINESKIIAVKHYTLKKKKKRSREGEEERMKALKNNIGRVPKELATIHGKSCCRSQSTCEIRN